MSKIFALKVATLRANIILKNSSKSNFAKLSKFSRIVKNCQKYWIYDAIIWGMNVFIGYMLPTFGKNMDMEVIQMIDWEVANIVNE